MKRTELDDLDLFSGTDPDVWKISPYELWGEEFAGWLAIDKATGEYLYFTSAGAGSPQGQIEIED